MWALCHRRSGHTRGPVAYTKPALRRGSEPGSTPNTQASCRTPGCVSCAVHLSSPEEKRGCWEVAQPCVGRDAHQGLWRDRLDPGTLSSLSCPTERCTLAPCCQDGWPPIVRDPHSLPLRGCRPLLVSFGASPLSLTMGLASGWWPFWLLPSPDPTCSLLWL